MADEMDGVDLFNLHATIVNKLHEQFPKFKLIEFYRSEEERKPPTLNELPALFLEMDFEINLDGDSGSEQLPLIARVEARVIDSFERRNFKINIRSLATQVAYYIFKNKRFHAYNGSTAVGPATLDTLTQDHFYPSLKSYEVWRVDFSIPILVGENIWKQIGETPIPVYSYTPDVGIGHEQDYQEIDL